ncbi:MAG: hypothetical protein ACE5PV_22345 [Candidatus Poribacteria bacterium]
MRSAGAPLPAVTLFDRKKRGKLPLLLDAVVEMDGLASASINRRVF